VLNNANYNKFIQVIIYFVHKHQIQLLTFSVIMTFLSIATQVVFHTLSSSGGNSVHKMLFTDVKSFHQCTKPERKLSVLCIPRNQVCPITCNRNNNNIIHMYWLHC